MVIRWRLTGLHQTQSSLRLMRCVISTDGRTTYICIITVFRGSLKSTSSVLKINTVRSGSTSDLCLSVGDKSLVICIHFTIKYNEVMVYAYILDFATGEAHLIVKPSLSLSLAPHSFREEREICSKR